VNKGWHPDPTGRFEQRFWDGAKWTSQVHSNCYLTVDPFEREPEPEPEPPPGPSPEDVAAEASPLLATSFLRVDQTRAVTRPAYALKDASGSVLGTIEDRGSGLAGAVDVLSLAVDLLDQAAPHHMEVRDAAGTLVLLLVKPFQLLTTRLVVLRPSGTELGRIETNVLYRRYVLRAGDREVGHAAAQGVRFSRLEVCDHIGAVVGGVEKRSTGWFNEVTSSEDAFEVRLADRIRQPLRALALMLPIALDQALYEQKRS
jgi:hypothetical protein